MLGLQLSYQGVSIEQEGSEHVVPNSQALVIGEDFTVLEEVSAALPQVYHLGDFEVRKLNLLLNCLVGLVDMDVPTDELAASLIRHHFDVLLLVILGRLGSEHWEFPIFHFRVEVSVVVELVLVRL